MRINKPGIPIARGTKLNHVVSCLKQCTPACVYNCYDLNYNISKTIVNTRYGTVLLEIEFLRYCYFLSEPSHQFRVNDQFSSRLHRVKIQTGMHNQTNEVSLQ